MCTAGSFMAYVVPLCAYSPVTVIFMHIGFEGEGEAWHVSILAFVLLPSSLRAHCSILIP